ncbi:hypothetical protein NYZ23_19840, partial [Acinetobacter baumannii]|nr:hypothetical protein [Acinetobacter baumannii]
GPLVDVIKRLAFASMQGGAGAGVGAGQGGEWANSVPGMLAGDAVQADASGMGGMMAVNMIRAHRDELVRASTGTLDHMVIDIVAALFD